MISNYTMKNEEATNKRLTTIVTQNDYNYSKQLKVYEKPDS